MVFLGVIERLRSGVSVVAVVGIEFFLRDIPEIIPKGAEIGEVVYRLSLSYISSYIFYFVVVHLIKRDHSRHGIVEVIQEKER